jgi:hypothetical protein
VSKKHRLQGLLDQKQQVEPKGSPVKREILQTTTLSSDDTSIHDSVSGTTLSKIEKYKASQLQKTTLLSHAEMFKQQNVYIDRELIKAIDKILKKNKKLSKQDIYNNALKMYLDVVFDTKVDLISEKNK